MKIEDSNVVMKSDVQSTQSHNSSIVKFELTHGLEKLQENAYKAHKATELLLNPDFSTYKGDNKAIYSNESSMNSEDKCKKDILADILDKFFNYNNDIFLFPQKDIDENKLKDTLLVIETKEEYHKKQTVDFTAQIEIKTPNNNYHLDLEVGFTEELYEVHEKQLTLGNTALIDPLVINYDEDINPFKNLSKLRFEFDLNNDGENEFIPLLKKGAGFLAHDKNNNGKIDNGTELFGPQTNHGFEELAKHDSDKNNWIDENDKIFNELKVWQINDSGENKLVSLLDINVGAIYLGEVQSGFTYQNGISEVTAVQRSNGIYVKNDGSGVRMINALDLSST